MPTSLKSLTDTQVQMVYYNRLVMYTGTDL